jgi:glycosyltransferase involved in cell wall biosynthesis
VAVELSVILCTHNGAATIGEQLDALASQGAATVWELIVVANRCTDDTVDVVKRHALPDIPVRVITADERNGLSYARNVGVAAAQGTALAFCDDDDIVGDGWVDEIARAVRVQRFVGSRMEYDRLNSPETMRGRARFQEHHLAEMFGYSMVNGAGAAIERELWRQVGGNDEDLTDTGEDTDLAIRVQKECAVSPVLAGGALYHYRQREGARAAYRQGAAYGRAHVMLFVRHGRDRVDLAAERRRARRDWWWITTRSPYALARARRTAWARRTGIRVGRLQASLRRRVWFP